MIFLNGFSRFCYSIMFLPFCEVVGVLFGYPEKTKTEPVAEQKPIEQTVSVAETKQPETVVQADDEKDLWASVRKMGNSAAMIEELESVGIFSMEEFYNIYHRSDAEKKKLQANIDTQKSKIAALKKLISNIKTYDKTKSVNEEYKRKSGLSKTLYKKKHSDEIEQFNSACAFIKANSESFLVEGKVPKIADLEKTLKTLETDYKALVMQLNELENKRDAVFKYHRKIWSYNAQKTNKRQHELSNQKIKQKKKGVWLE